jgi:hypothetical protein
MQTSSGIGASRHVQAEVTAEKPLVAVMHAAPDVDDRQPAALRVAS